MYMHVCTLSYVPLSDSHSENMIIWWLSDTWYTFMWLHFNVIFVDRFLQTAEMLKPSTPSASHDNTGSSGTDDGAEYYPHIGNNYMLKKKQFEHCLILKWKYPIKFLLHPVFLQNKARRDDFCPRNLKNMHMVVDKLMTHSHLKYKGAKL